MKKVVITVSILLSLTAIGVFVIRPMVLKAYNSKFTWSNVDWLNKTVKYKNPITSGTADLKELSKSGMGLMADKGDMAYNISAAGDSLVFTTRKGSETTQTLIVDFAKRQITENGKVQQFS